MFAQARLTGLLSPGPVSGALTPLLATLLLVICCCLSGQAWAGHPGIIKLDDAHTWRVNDGEYLNAQFIIELSSGASEAVKNGIPLTFELQVQVVQTHTWFWDSVKIEFTARRTLQYHALSETYQVKDLGDGSQGNYRHLDDALLAVGSISDLLLTDKSLGDGKNYSIRLRGSLDIEALPTPVRLIAYVSSEWGMVSKWYKWSLVR